jgi:tRNA A37 threonylcarbamoyltransferase TsaD
MAKTKPITITELWSGMIDNLTANGGMDFLLSGLKSQCTGRVKEDQDSENSVQFTLDIDWKECTFEHLISLAMRTVRIDAQSKMRTDGIPTEGATVPISVSKKTIKGVATPEGLVKKFEKMTSTEQSAFLDLMNSALGN